MTNIISATITAYCACKLCCGPNAKGINANNTKPIPGYSIAASRKIRLGTKVIIAGHTYTVDDRLAKKYDSRFDIFFATHREALQFGIRKETVTIITK